MVALYEVEPLTRIEVELEKEEERIKRLRAICLWQMACDLRLKMKWQKKFVVLFVIPFLVACGDPFEPREEEETGSQQSFTHTYEGALEILNDQMWLALVPEDSDGVRTGGATITVNMKISEQGRVELAEVVITSSDSKGKFKNIFRYDLETKSGVLNTFDKRSLRLTTFDDAGHLDATGEGSEQRISGEVRLDSRSEVFGRYVMDLKNRR